MHDMPKMRVTPPPIDDCSQCDAKQVPVHYLHLHFGLFPTAKKVLEVHCAACYQCMIDLGVWSQPVNDDGPSN